MEQGYDPRDFSLVAFGGAGPLHANSLGRLIGAFPVIVPPSPGVLCALGDVTTILRHEIGKTFVGALHKTDPSELLATLNELLEQIKKIMTEEQGVPEGKQVSHCSTSTLFPSNRFVLCCIVGLAWPMSC